MWTNSWKDPKNVHSSKPRWLKGPAKCLSLDQECSRGIGGRDTCEPPIVSSLHPRSHIWATLTSTWSSQSFTCKGCSCSSTGKIIISLWTLRWTWTLVQPSPLKLEYRRVAERTQPSLLIWTDSTIASLYLALICDGSQIMTSSPTQTFLDFWCHFWRNTKQGATSFVHFC